MRTMVMDAGGGEPSSIITFPETYMGRENVGLVFWLGVVGVVVVGVGVVVVGVVPVPVPVPVDVPPPLACANREMLQAVVRRSTYKEFRIGTS
jgi:hypothetical protein